MLDTKQIKSEVEQLQADVRSWKMKEDQFRGMSLAVLTANMKTKYEYLFNNSNTLFNNCMNGSINNSQLDYMLAMIDKVNGGGDYNTASIAVGQKLVDIYVKPMLDDMEKNKTNSQE
jgi:hypothetical protein